MPATTAQTRSQYPHLASTLRGLEEDLRWGLDGSPRIPAAWQEIALAEAVPRKIAVTMRIDEDVTRFFRAMGRGHLSRMNAVLRTFMQARLAGVVTGPEATEYRPLPMEQYLQEGREVITLISARNARARAGIGTETEDQEVDRRLARLSRMADEMGLGTAERLF
jgi:hypothetical protein